MSEYLFIEKPFLNQLAALGWEVSNHGKSISCDALAKCVAHGNFNPRRPVQHPTFGINDGGGGRLSEITNRCMMTPDSIASRAGEI